MFLIITKNKIIKNNPQIKLNNHFYGLVYEVIKIYEKQTHAVVKQCIEIRYKTVFRDNIGNVIKLREKNVCRHEIEVLKEYQYFTAAVNIFLLYHHSSGNIKLTLPLNWISRHNTFIIFISRNYFLHGCLVLNYIYFISFFSSKIYEWLKNEVSRYLWNMSHIKARAEKK